MLVQTLQRARPAVLRRAGVSTLLPLSLVLLVAVALRFVALDWDGGHYAHPDELHIADVATNRLQWPADLSTLPDPDTSPMNPRRLGDDGQRLSYSYGALLVYALKGVSGAASALLGEDRYAGFGGVYAVGRFISAIADVLTVLALYLLGRRLFGDRVGLLAAAFSALTVLQIQYSHYYVAEPLMMMFLLYALLGIVAAWREGGIRWVALTGICLGLAVATKPSGAAFLPGGVLLLFVSAFARAPQDTHSGRAVVRSRLGTGLRRALLAGAVALLAWGLWEPYAVLDPVTYVENIRNESRIQSGDLDYPYTRQYVGTVPGWYHLSQFARWSVGLPLGAAVVAGLGWALYAVLRRRDLRYGLLLLWIAPYTVSILMLEAKWLRYMLPISPVLVLLASAALLEWDARPRATRAGSGPVAWLRPRLARLGILAVLTGTALWALAFMQVYSSTHPWVAASSWIYANVPSGATLGVEHWDRQLPLDLPGGDSGRYEYSTIAMYDDLPPREKLGQVGAVLESADYIVLATNRLYGSIPRSPWRYAVATRYYELLFEERLGFRQVAGFDVSPGLGPLSVNERGADESFSVYDHPTVLVFQKERELEAWELEALFDEALDAEWLSERHGESGKTLLLDPFRDPAVTGRPYFSGIFGGWAAVAVWLLALEALGVAAWALLASLFGRAPATGWALGKLLGILLVSWLAWLVPSLGLLPAGQGLTWGIALLLFLAAATVAVLRRRELLGQLRLSWRVVLAFEALFLALFAAGALLRAANPDLWQPYFGGEKPMELAFINGILRSSELPPYDPWFSGGYINYYYFGQWIAATLMRLAAVGPQYGFNLAVATVFALAGTLAAALGYLVGGRTGRLAGTLVGGLSLGFVLLLGNLDGAVQAAQHLSGRGSGSLWERFDFWRSTRLFDGIINEFPYFTFLYGDLHAHMVSMPLGLALLVIAAYVVLFRHEQGGWTVLLLCVLVGLLTGAIAVTNPWDAPGYFGLFFLALALYSLTRAAHLPARVARLGTYALSALAIAVLGFLPFFLSFKSFYGEVGLVQDPTPLPHYLNMLGLFLFVAAWYGATTAGRSRHGRPILALAVAGLLLGFLLGRGVLALILGLLALSLFALWEGRRSSQVLVWSGLAAGGLLIWAGIEVLYLKDFLADTSAYRMNTVFKFGLQSWILLALGCAGLLLLALRQTRRIWSRSILLVLAAVLVGSSLVYPVYGSATRLRQRFPEPPQGLTLDGERFLRTATLANESGEQLDFRHDLDAIRWLRRNVQRPETIVEAAIGPYRGNGGRVSMFTGLPAVVGWDNHESQQRYPEPVARRNSDVRDLYSSPSPQRALEIISRYGIRYIYVGPVERLHELASPAGSGLPPEPYASAAGLEKFERMTGSTLRVAYRNPGVTIYEVLPSWQWPADAGSTTGSGRG